MDSSVPTLPHQTNVRCIRVVPPETALQMRAAPNLAVARLLVAIHGFVNTPPPIFVNVCDIPCRTKHVSVRSKAKERLAANDDNVVI
jgi:hypothetical protein